MKRLAYFFRFFHLPVTTPSDSRPLMSHSHSFGSIRPHVPYTPTLTRSLSTVLDDCSYSQISPLISPFLHSKINKKSSLPWPTHSVNPSPPILWRPIQVQQRIVTLFFPNRQSKKSPGSPDPPSCASLAWPYPPCCYRSRKNYCLGFLSHHWHQNLPSSFASVATVKLNPFVLHFIKNLRQPPPPVLSVYLLNCCLLHGRTRPNASTLPQTPASQTVATSTAYI